MGRPDRHPQVRHAARAAALREPIVINCTGLGAKDLFGDQELVPLKGQLTVMVPQPEVNYHTNGGVPPVPGASLGIHMMARSDGIVLGGTSQRGVWTLEPDEAERKRVVDSHIAVFGAMKHASRQASRFGTDVKIICSGYLS